MSVVQYAAYRRQPVAQQAAQNLQMLVFPAPTRGIIESENAAYMLDGGALVQDNWLPTMRGVKLRGGCIRWCVLPEQVPIISAFEYVTGSEQRMFAAQATKLYDVTTSTPALVVAGQI